MKNGTKWKHLIGVMGPANGEDRKALEQASVLGELIAGKGWILLTGGCAAGVMDAASIAARKTGGLTVGILPDRGPVSSGVMIPIFTDMGSGRNNINVLSSDVVIACGMGPGTASEISLALKAGRPVVLLGCGKEAERFFKKMGRQRVSCAGTPVQAVKITERILESRNRNS